MPDVTDEMDPDLRRYRARQRARAFRVRVERIEADLAAETRDMIAILRADGLSYREIGAELDRSHTWVARQLASGDGGPSAA